MSRRTPLIASVVAAAVLVPSAAEAATITVRESDTNKIVALTKGDRLRIVLAENPTTGHSWRTTRRPAKRVLRFVSSRYVPDDAPEGTVGSGGTRVFVYRAARKGPTSLVLAHVGPGRDAPVVDRFRLSISVR